MVLERKYGPLDGFTPVTDIVLNYLSEVKTIFDDKTMICI